MKTALLFPGQGAQKIGMGQDVYDASPAARELFETAERVTGLPLKRLCFEGPDDQLARTDNAQPAIFTVSAAMLACLAQQLDAQPAQKLQAACTAGLSLGEYTALYAAGMLSFEDALKLVTRRGAAMQAAALAVPSGMVSVIGLDQAGAQKLCDAAAQGQVLTCANFNCPGQVVLSGQLDACRRAEELAGEYGASGAVPLNVAGAFHSELMAPAARELAQAIAEVDFRTPAAGKGGQMFATPETRVVANVDAKPYADPGEVADKLLAQLTGPVRWQQSIGQLLAAGVEKFYEVGPGRVLAGLMRRIDRNADLTSVNSLKSVEKLAGEM